MEGDLGEGLAHIDGVARRKQFWREIAGKLLLQM